MQTWRAAGRTSRPATLEDLFLGLYRVDGAAPDLSGIRIHRVGADGACAAWDASAMTVGSDIYVRAGCYAPHTRAGLWLLAHEVAHVVQQRRGPVEAVPVTRGWAVAPCRGAEEREADAAADAVLAGRPFVFGPPAPRADASYGKARNDSFAAGHLANKTLIMQWYVEWLLASGSPIADRALLREMTYQRQPLLHGPDLYNPKPGADGDRLYPDGNSDPCTVTDPQSAIEGRTLEARIQSSGISGGTAAQREQRYLCYLALLRSSVAQLSAGVVHDYLNQRSLVVASRPDGTRYRMWGDRAMFAGEAAAVQAATAAHASRRAIADLLVKGETDIASRRIFESVPRYVEVHGALLPLRQWQDAELRDLCFGKLFGQPSTRVRKLLLGLLSRNFGLPAEDYTELRDRLGTALVG